LIRKNFISSEYPKQGLSLKKSIVSDILKNEDKIVNAPDSFCLRDRKAKYPALEDCLYIFCAEAWVTMVILEDWLVKINNAYKVSNLEKSDQLFRRYTFN